MTKYRLLSELTDPPLRPSEERSTIRYQTYELNINGVSINIGIPARECTIFEQYLEENDIEDIDNNTLKEILRKFRGIKVT